MLSTEQEMGLRLRGEHGIMRKKFDALHKEIEEQKEENRLLDEHKKDLYQVGTTDFWMFPHVLREGRRDNVEDEERE